MDIYKTRIGDKVRYHNKNGYDSERKYANKFLKEGEEYEVSEPIRIGRSNSGVYLKEIYSYHYSSGKKDYPISFNTVMFENVEDVSNRREKSGDWDETYTYVIDGKLEIRAHRYDPQEELKLESELAQKAADALELKNSDNILSIGNFTNSELSDNVHVLNDSRRDYLTEFKKEKFGTNEPPKDCSEERPPSVKQKSVENTLKFEDLINKSGLEFTDISSESYRVYLKDSSVVEKINEPIALYVSENGHGIVDSTGLHYFLHNSAFDVIKWKPKTGYLHFIK